MGIWFRFVAVVSLQLCVFLALAIYCRIAPRKILQIMVKSASLGIPLGLCFDFIVGRYNTIFGYYPFSPPLMFYLLNGMLSYGLAIASVWIIPQSLVAAHRRGGIMMLALLILVGAAGTLLFLPDLRISTLVLMFAGGTAILALAEASAIFKNASTPLMEALGGRPRMVLQLWGISVAMGTIYEIGNWLFPVWRWSPVGGFNFLQQEILLVVCGYFVLIYFMVILTHNAED
jgi:hypothetical protein